MTFNELCTNATKFGALSTPSGRVEIGWVVDQAQRLRLTWTEIGGPPVHAPNRKSFGTRLIGSLGQQLNGHVELAYPTGGFVYELEVPVSSLNMKV
jgi:two-component sensor histidine kinase